MAQATTGSDSGGGEALQDPVAILVLAGRCHKGNFSPEPGSRHRDVARCSARSAVGIGHERELPFKRITVDNVDLIPADDADSRDPGNANCFGHGGIYDLLAR